ncbi:hypothetical protein [Clostridium sp.]|uniref:hypothetical protein n=1 Tax=Clostridium sp. TaxID=1506 RepID=UPI003F39AEEA
MKIWIKYPDKMSINIISPSGEQSGFVVPKIKMFDEFMYYLLDIITLNKIQ